MIELVIKIPEDEYHNILLTGKANLCTVNAIQSGTILPKGHGTLKDTDELHSIFEKNCDAYNIDNLSFISDMDMNFDLAPIIIETDKESEYANSN